VSDANSRPPGQSRPEGKTPYVTSAVGLEETAGRLRARRTSLFTQTMVWVAGLICLAFLLGALMQAWSNSQLTQVLQSEQQKTQQIQNQHNDLTQQANHYQDPYIVENEARQQLGEARSGEHVVVVAGASEPGQTSTSATTSSSAPQNFWQAWWSLFFGVG
jgi:cell division protein FtsB